MRVVLMRHGEAGDADPARWSDDRDRPLTDEGRREHAQVAAGLRRTGVGFDRILTSPLARARETALITARAYGGDPAPEETELLGDRAEPARVEAASLLCVGHEPTLSRLAATLISRDGSARVEMRKSGVAVIDFAGPVGAGRGVLVLHLRPAELTRLASAPGAAGAAPSISISSPRSAPAGRPRRPSPSAAGPRRAALASCATTSARRDCSRRRTIGTR